MRISLVGLVFLFISFHAQARRSSEWELHLEHSLSAISYLEEYGEHTNKDLYKINLNPHFRWKYLDTWRVIIKPSLVLNPNNNSNEEQTFFDINEAFLRFQKETWSLQLGNTIYSWGVTDGYNPLDVVNQKQYFDPLHSTKLGSPSVLFTQGFDDWDYELIYIPRNREAQLPGAQSRWLPRKVLIPQSPENDLILKLPEELNYSYSTRKNIDSPLDNNLAMRFQYRGSFFDAALSAYEGVSPFPIVQPEVTGVIEQVSPKTVIRVDPNVALHTKNFRLRQSGLSLVSNQQHYLIKYATSYTQTLGEDPLLLGWTHENIIALEKTFNVGSEGLLIAVLQHSFLNSEKSNDSNLSMQEVFRRAWMIGGKLSWKEVWNFSFLGLYDSIRGGHFEELSISRRLYDSWTLQLSSSFIDGPSDTPLGVYGNNDSIGVTVSSSF